MGLNKELDPSINDIVAALRSSEPGPLGLCDQSSPEVIAAALEDLTLSGVLNGLAEDFGGMNELLIEIESATHYEQAKAPEGPRTVYVVSSDHSAILGYERKKAARRHVRRATMAAARMREPGRLPEIDIGTHWHHLAMKDSRYGITSLEVLPGDPTPAEVMELIAKRRES